MKKLLLPFILLIFFGCNKKEESPQLQRFNYKITSAQNVPDFNSQNAMTYVTNQLEFGPRNPNSTGHKQAMNFFKVELGKFADTVFVQNFSYPGYDGERLECGNVIASFSPKNTNRILLCAHWDTRPKADKDKDPSKQNLPILGANDGASGVAVLLEIAKILHSKKIDYGIDIVLFDAEDYGKEGDLINYSIGAKYFIQNKPNHIKPAFGILLDMVGDKNAKFKREPNSMRFAPDVVDLVWQLALNLGLTTFSNEVSSPIYDDHIPLGEMGMKIINIIDADLIGADSPEQERNYWHTHQDTIDKISEKTLGEVGQLLVHLIYSLKFVPA